MKPRVEVCFDKAKRRAFCGKKPEYSPRQNEFLLNHARSGLLLALQSLGLPQGSKVGVMVYNCHTVMNAVAQAGLQVVFIDVDDGLKIDIDDLRKKSEGMKAVVVTHLFGVFNDIEAIRNEFPQLLVIEDCAHAFGKEIVGDFGVYSIGQGKLPSIGDGGVLVVKSEGRIGKVDALYQRLPEYSRRDDAKLFCKLWLTHLMHGKWLYGLVTSRLKRSKKPQSGREAIAMKKMSRGVRAMLALEKDNLEGQVRLRRANAQQEMGTLEDNALVKHAWCGENPFMLVVRSENVAELRRQYALRGVETATHFAHSLHWAKTFGYQGDCPNAERLMKELLMIPVY